MPDVFTDFANDYDLTITTSADWTVHSAVLPNGDNAIAGDGTIAATFNSANGDDFNFGTGNWSIEFWLYYAATPGTTVTLLVNSLGTSANNADIHWLVQLGSSGAIIFTMFNTSGGTYTSRTSANPSTSAWHHVAIVKLNGAVPVIYLDNAASSTGSTAITGTAVTPTSGFNLYLGTLGNGTGDLGSNTRFAHLAIYDSELTDAQRAEHIAVMTAT